MYLFYGFPKLLEELDEMWLRRFKLYPSNFSKPTSGKEVAFLQMIFWTKSRTLDLERTTMRFWTKAKLKVS